jgi:lysophospholipase L1-like esterase
MRTRLPIALGIAIAVCCLLTGSPLQIAAARKKPAPKKTPKKTRRVVPPPVSAAMRVAALERVDRYLTESGARPIEQPAALAPFFDQLRASGENAAPIHIIHYGDSHTAADDWTGGLRDLFRERFGDGGSGFSLAGHPFPGYRRFDARGGGTALWQTVGGRAGNGDGLFGLGGMGVATERPGQSVYLNAECDRLEVHFLKQPRGGRLALYDYEERLDEFTTEGETGAGFMRYTVSPGPHRFLLKTLDARPVRLLGWVADRAGGVTYEALGLNGAEAGVILKWNEEMLACYLQRRSPGLIVLAYGTNEASDPFWNQESYRDMYASLIARLHKVAPAASILAIGPDDRWTSAGGRWHPMPGIDRIIADQREVCRVAGCAYWDLRERMGGSGSMRDWVYSGFAQADHVHLTSIGYRRMSAVLFGDLMRQFESYKNDQPTK